MTKSAAAISHGKYILATAIAFFMLVSGEEMPVLAEPYVVRTMICQEGTDVTFYVKDDETDFTAGVTDLSAQVGTSMCPVDMITQGKVSELENAHYRTVILMDNSASISMADKEKALNVITQVIRDHAEDEVFSLYTFAEEPVVVSENSRDYETLIVQLHEISYADQDSCLFDSLCRVLSDMQKRGGAQADYFRLILVSDGANDHSYGSSLNDVLDTLKDKTFGCVLYALGCTWEKDKSGLKDLQRMAEATGGYFFTLNQYEDTGEITRRMDRDHQAVFFRTEFPITQKDGEEKNISFSYNLGSSHETVSAQLLVPESAIEEQTVSETESETEHIQTDETAQKLTEKPKSPVNIQIEVNTQTERQKEKKVSFSGSDEVSSYAYLLMGLMAGAATVLVIILVMRRHREKVRKSNRDDFHDHLAHRDHRNDVYSPGNIGNDSNTGKKGNSGLPRKTAGPDEKEGRTVMLWDSQPDENRLILTDVRNGSRRWSCVITNAVTLGRSADCDFCFDDDRRISGNHCRFVYRTGTVWIEDLSSTNGTFLNQGLVHTPVPVKSGDVLTMGRTSLLIEIEKNRLPLTSARGGQG